ncbi:MAG: tryptophan-rich sensory protein [Verrucomicrobia bacterium]|nr:tryptophan-rich sensory protein [Verrucomicrobiota bacterium]
MKKRVWGWLVFWLAASVFVAFFGSMFRPGEWYADLNKPGWTPPSWLFGPVWSFLYLTMAIAAWLVTRKVGFYSLPVLLYSLQLLCNGLWSWIFFGQQEIGWALVDIGTLLVLLLLTTFYFWRVSKPAGLLLVPYVVWVSFATGLNFAIWRMN